ncbi:MAG: hypothetical protein IK007_08780 [Lachnospiraceae bacterium]|nr:hypothetical protein [Lachnospiraceae bacterium]
MKDLLKNSIKGLVCALVLALVSGIGAVTASAGTLSADLDGDGKEEQIEWDEDDLDTITVNNTGVLKEADLSSSDFDAEGFGVYTNLYIKTESGKKGWINTSEYDYANFMIENPPLWG